MTQPNETEALTDAEKIASRGNLRQLVAKANNNARPAEQAKMTPGEIGASGIAKKNRISKIMDKILTKRK
ncbi:hypothetical protein [Pararhizobium sp.]|uniref:hypothetical protein n=1 Tax=Pararhizobium sp. TaxID=1977563 RepID=UPI00272936DC|nr:hypothetical protein [Pararhizobium sp.]MDO9417965.1 hypothetical protein [Pararhizobium sp.]